MNKLKFLSVSLSIVGSINAYADCYLAKQGDKVLKQDGDCKTAYTPQSTFKVPLAVMGFDSGILQDENSPVFSDQGYTPNINVCKGPHNPREWMRDSCVWYSQELTKKLGMEKFKEYVEKFNYGNKDISGGLTTAWLSSTIKISPIEQVEFMEKLASETLPVSKKAVAMTKKIMFVTELPGGWKLFAKTGSGRLKGDLQQGWYAGWIEKGDQKVIFVNHIADKKKQKSYASFRSRNDTMIKLWDIIEEKAK